MTGRSAGRPRPRSGRTCLCRTGRYRQGESGVEGGLGLGVRLGAPSRPRVLLPAPPRPRAGSRGRQTVGGGDDAVEVLTLQFLELFEDPAPQNQVGMLRELIANPETFRAAVPPV